MCFQEVKSGCKALGSVCMPSDIRTGDGGHKVKHADAACEY